MNCGGEYDQHKEWCKHHRVKKVAVPDPEPLSSLYRRVVEAVPEAAVTYGIVRLVARDGLVCWADLQTPPDQEAIAAQVGWHLQVLCDERGIEVRRQYDDEGFRTGPFCAWIEDDPMSLIDPFPDRLPALVEALIAYANRSKSDA